MADRKLLMLLLSLGIFVFLNPSCLRAANTPPEEYLEWRLPVGVPSGLSKEIRQQIVELAANWKTATWEAQGNPVCCFWFELESWKPSPNDDYYMIIIQPLGAVLRATDEAQLRKGIKALGESAQVKDGKVMLPRGVITNLKVFDKANAGNPKTGPAAAGK